MKFTFLLFVSSFFILSCGTQTSQNKAISQKQETQAVPEPAPVFEKLRNMFLTSPPEEFNFDSSRADYKVYGVLMETGYQEGLATLVSLRDGNASLYLGNGGGVIGGFGHESVRNAATDFVKESEKYLTGMKSTKSFTYPAVGQVKFYVLTFEGVATAEANESALGEGKHALSALFFKGQEVLTQLRLITEKQ